MDNKSLEYRLDSKTADIIKSKTGFSVDELADMSVDEWHDALQKRVGRKLHYSTFPKYANQIGRGQIYPYLNRLISKKDFKKLAR